MLVRTTCVKFYFVIQLLGRMHGSHTNTSRWKWLISMQTSNEEDHRSARRNLSSCEKKAYIFSSQQHKLRLLLQWSFRHQFVNSVVQIYEIYVFIISMQVVKFGEFLNPRAYTQPWYKGGASSYQSSLSRWKCTRKGGREGDNGRDVASPAVSTLPMVPCGSLPIARNYLAKNEAPEEEGGGGGWNPSPKFLSCCSIPKRFYL